MFSPWSIYHSIFYVNTNQKGAFTAYSAIQSLNGLTLLSATKYSGRNWSEACKITI